MNENSDFILIFLIGLSLTAFPAIARSETATTAKATTEEKPGQSLGIASVPNLRDLGGYKTKDGKTVTRGLVYRSNQLCNISPADKKKLADLKLKTAYDLRTAEERKKRPGEVPPGVNYVWLNVLADSPESGAAQLEKLMQNPKEANAALGDGKAEAAFQQG
jgi:protein-tyrosine phosphatase